MLGCWYVGLLCCRCVVCVFICLVGCLFVGVLLGCVVVPVGAVMWCRCAACVGALRRCFVGMLLCLCAV